MKGRIAAWYLLDSWENLLTHLKAIWLTYTAFYLCILWHSAAGDIVVFVSAGLSVGTYRNSSLLHRVLGRPFYFHLFYKIANLLENKRKILCVMLSFLLVLEDDQFSALGCITWSTQCGVRLVGNFFVFVINYFDSPLNVALGINSQYECAIYLYGTSRWRW